MATEGNASRQPAAPAPGREQPPPAQRSTRRAQLRRFARAVRDSDLATADEVILRLSQSRRWLAPLAVCVGAFAMLFVGIKLLFTNWRLTLIQVLPAMWIWAAMYDLKAHFLRGKTFHVLTGPVVIPLVLAVAVITAASFYLNAVFAYAISGQGAPMIRPAFTKAWSRRMAILVPGLVIGILLGLSTIVVVRWGRFWFGFCLSIVIAIMMICYVAVPARLIGMKTSYPRRDKLAATAVGGIVGAVVCTPPYVLGRIGLLMLKPLFIPGLIVFIIGLTLQAGATSAVKTVKMSATLVSGHPRPGADSPAND